MSEFLRDLAQHDFLRFALLAGVLASIPCGVVGSYVVVRRITYIAGGIAHSVLGGIGAAVYLHGAWGWDWLDPMHGATVAALLSAALIGIVSLRAREREDTVISAVWAVGMALGVLFLRLTPGYAQDPMAYLFGTVTLVSRADLVLILLLNAIVLVPVLLFHRQFTAICFDEEFARLRGVHVELLYLVLLALTALTVVILIRVVGIVLVIALLTLPVAIATHFAQRLARIMLIAALLCVAFTVGGIFISYQAEFPTGATIVILCGGVYLMTAAGAAVAGRRAAE